MEDFVLDLTAVSACQDGLVIGARQLCAFCPVSMEATVWLPINVSAHQDTRDHAARKLCVPGLVKMVAGV